LNGVFAMRVNIFNMNIKKNGFTLVELIIAVAVGLLILTAVYASINMAQRSSASVGRKVVTQQDARSVLDLMAMEIRMASYNPTSTKSIWLSIPTAACASMGSFSPVNANIGIQTAAGTPNANTIVIAMDLNADRIIGPPGTSEYIEYSYNGADTITRNVNCGNDQPILGGAGSATMVRNNAAGMSLFQYFDSNGAATTSIPAIRRIRITIVADTESNDNLTSKTRRMTYTTDVLVPNHALSQ
jgi:prepilin-type N-terminal cleavage/methylation domain-containing protein